MRILLMSVTAGRGHIATAQAMQNYLEPLGHECKILDVFEYASPLLKEMIDKGYLASTAFIPKAFGKVYRFADRQITPAPKFSVTNFSSMLLLHELRYFIEEYAPDIIIATHPCAAVPVDMMIRKHDLDALTAVVITDFTVHPFLQETMHLDYYVTASELLDLQLRRKGLDPKKNLPYGIPIHPKFSQRIPQEEARAQLGLDLHKPTILIMSGSMGFGKIDHSIQRLDALDMDFQGIVVCGNNHSMYEKISSMTPRHFFQVNGFVNNVELMMDASDCIVTKPGGLTSSEALAKELPMIMINPIPGQEDRNVEFMLNNQLAMYSTKTYPLDEAVFTLFHEPDRIQRLRENIQRMGKKNSTQRVCDFLLQQAAIRRNKPLPTSVNE